MRKNKRLKLKPETIRSIGNRGLREAIGGISGEPCDLTEAHTKCDGPGCATTDVQPS